jgi:hypothetical protein
MHLVGFTAVEIGRNVQTGSNGDARTRRRAVQTPESHFLRRRTPFRTQATFIPKSWLSDF